MSKLSHPLPRYPIEPEDENVLSPSTEPVLVDIPPLPYDSVTLVEVLQDIGPPSANEQYNRPMLQAEAGDTIQVLERWTGDKWKGLRLRDNSTGFFLLDERVRPLLPSRVYSLWSYVAERAEQLPLYMGESVEVLDKKGGWWFLGGSEHGFGLIPFNYVIPITDDPLDQVMESRKEVHTVRAFTSWEAQDSLGLSFEAGEEIVILKKRVNGPWIGRIRDKVGIFPVEYTTGRADARQPVLGPYYVRTLYDFDAPTKLELDFRHGEIVEVFLVCDDSWCLGRSRGGKEGWFLSEWVEPILDRRMEDFS